ncbi:MAG: hypothetical protein HQ461_05255, partial [Deltaproteobacteria bacterium]|nr:hypothetical protein [Deltaproteobacteria bacterium]
PLLVRVVLASLPMVAVAAAWRWSWFRFGDAGAAGGAVGCAATGLGMVWLLARRRR